VTQPESGCNEAGADAEALECQDIFETLHQIRPVKKPLTSPLRAWYQSFVSLADVLP